MASSEKPGLLISFGGNALNVAEAPPSHQKEEFAVARKSLQGVIALLKAGYGTLALCHGNGPQVGQIFLQQELTRHDFPRQITLDVCVADSQGRIGYILQNTLDNLCREQGMNKRALAVITQVLVDADDPAFKKPTKPIGLFYSKAEADALVRDRGWVMMEDAGRGYRRVVASPAPREIIEIDGFREILSKGIILIGGGGGGVPVVRTEDGGLSGVEAVIDKDFTSGLIARELKLDWLVILTGVDRVYRNFNSGDAVPIDHATADEMELLLAAGEFAEGSMKPKVAAAIQFLRAGGKRAVIAHLNDLVAAVQGKVGTHIVLE